MGLPKAGLRCLKVHDKSLEFPTKSGRIMNKFFRHEDKASSRLLNTTSLLQGKNLFRQYIFFTA